MTIQKSHLLFITKLFLSLLCWLTLNYMEYNGMSLGIYVVYDAVLDNFVLDFHMVHNTKAQI